MVTLRRFRLASLVAALSITSLSLLNPAKTTIAAVFGKTEVDPSKFVVVASPYSADAYQLLILEQLSDQRPCWSESGSNPTIIDPLLLKFDFTRICGRSTDSNGYSVRLADRDFGLLLQLSVLKRDNDLVLLAVDLTNRDAPPIEVGRTNGLPSAGAFAKINLSPGWRLTKRIDANGKPLGFVYLTSETNPSSIKLTAFVDTQSNWAKNYIDALAAQKIISGFEDGTFRPDEAVTRVQFAAIVSKAFASLPPERASLAFKDIQANFWGAGAIQTAYQKGFMSGYPDSTFKPNQQIPRVEALVSLASGLKLSSPSTDALSFYQDAAQIPSWANGAIAAATDRRLVVNYPRVKELNPARPATRAEVAAFVYQALADAGQLSVIPSPYVVSVGSQPPTNPPPPTVTTPSPLPSPSPTPAPTPTPTPTPTPSPLPSPTPSPTPAPTPTPTPSPLPSPSPTPTPLPSSNPGSVVVPTTPVNP
ncbi:DUF3747 domain-containing protein [Stenomitos frigidus]|uniref:DUF3747 domain-containing protein n=1 Tax=Stenomitos frigidus TaxID=1886765 RepID=UPI001C638D8A|nr:DUF3747 domain-containing protein [Stenomitos frigidus]